ncbi:hypothetical protein L0337_06060 [candidate division KSB1 bacterium]|nr:hypothetical protein [candidate division KSB1 bacterium]
MNKRGFIQKQLHSRRASPFSPRYKNSLHVRALSSIFNIEILTARFRARFGPRQKGWLEARTFNFIFAGACNHGNDEGNA